GLQQRRSRPRHLIAMIPCAHSLLRPPSTEAELHQRRTFSACCAAPNGVPGSANRTRAGMTPQEALQLFEPRFSDPNRKPPCGPEEHPRHLPLLKKYGIPWIVDLHCHFFPEVIQKLIWRWFDQVGWQIAYRTGPIERVSELRRNGIHYYTTLLYAHKPDMADGLNEWIFR